MTYLELCQKMVRDLGLQDTVGAVTGQLGMSAKIVDWIADADVYIQSLWHDWNFLWSQYSGSTIAGVREVAAPSDLGTWNRETFYLNYTSDDNIKLMVLEYKDWLNMYRQGTQTNGEPHSAVILPDDRIYFEPIPDAVYTFTADYWKTPTRMTANTSLSPIPARFHRIIIARAKIYYAEHDEFTNVYELAVAEFGDLLIQLQSAELPGHFHNLKNSRINGADMVVTPQ